MGDERHEKKTTLGTFFLIDSIDGLVKKSPKQSYRRKPDRVRGRRRYPNVVPAKAGNQEHKYTGFRVKHGMTKQGEIDFLRARQHWTSDCSGLFFPKG